MAEQISLSPLDLKVLSQLYATRMHESTTQSVTVRVRESHINVLNSLEELELAGYVVGKRSDAPIRWRLTTLGVGVLAAHAQA